jgi:hypothetical protein
MLASVDINDPLTWIQGGAVGATAVSIVGCFLKGWIVVGSHYTAAVARAEAAEAENRRIHDRLEGEVFDTLKAATVAMAQQNEIVKDALRR